MKVDGLTNDEVKSHLQVKHSTCVNTLQWLLEDSSVGRIWCIRWTHHGIELDIQCIAEVPIAYKKTESITTISVSTATTTVGSVGGHLGSSRICSSGSCCCTADLWSVQPITTECLLSALSSPRLLHAQQQYWILRWTECASSSPNILWAPKIDLSVPKLTSG